MAEEGRLIGNCCDGKVMVLGQQDRADHDQTPAIWPPVKLVEMNAEVLDMENETYRLESASRRYQDNPGYDHVSGILNQIWHCW